MIYLLDWWFKSYLKGRKQFVMIETEISSFQDVLTRVPHRSVLRPQLFLIYINDLNSSVKFSKTYYFVGDTNIMQTNK